MKGATKAFLGSIGLLFVIGYGKDFLLTIVDLKGEILTVVRLIDQIGSILGGNMGIYMVLAFMIFIMWKAAD